MTETLIIFNEQRELCTLSELLEMGFSMHHIINLNQYSSDGLQAVRELVLLIANIPKGYTYHKFIRFYGYLRAMELCGADLFDCLPPVEQSYISWSYVDSLVLRDSHHERVECFEELFFCE